MKNRILIVDDEVSILKSYSRLFRGKYNVDTAEDGASGLEALRQGSPYSVVISDFKMPGMDGIEFLEHAHKVSPNTVRILLTGFADLEVAVNAVNRCDIFRLLTKPCPDQLLRDSIDAGLRQHNLVVAEKELLRGTLRGSINLLREVIGQLKPEAAQFIDRIYPLVKSFSSCIAVDNYWEIEVAATLCLLGFITLPDQVIKKILNGRPLNPGQFQMYRKHIDIASVILSNIPRFGGVLSILKYQDKLYNGMGVPEDDVRERDIPLGARIIKLVKDYDFHLQKEKDEKRALANLRKVRGHYDPGLLDLFEKMIREQLESSAMSIRTESLEAGLILESDVSVYFDDRKVRALAKGTLITEDLVAKINRLSRMCTISDVVLVRKPRPGDFECHQIE